MAEGLLNYYERELTYFRQMGAEFAAKYPKIASRLLLEPDKCEDPHVERLIQSFAFLAGRIHKKLDDDYPELTESLFQILSPHFLAPIPSMSIAQFSPNSKSGQLAKGFVIQRGETLRSQPVNGEPCYFRTCFPVTLWPVAVDEVQQMPPEPGAVARALSLIRMRVRNEAGMPFPEVGVTSLRFYLDGESHVTFPLYEALLNQALEVRLRTLRPAQPTRAIRLDPASCIRPVGFESDEAMLPYPDRSFPGFRLLQEYFVFPQKFLFFELNGFGQLSGDEYAEGVEIEIYFDRTIKTERAIAANMFRLGCTPVVNLFQRTAEPIRFTEGQAEYRVLPDIRRPDAGEIYSIDDVKGSSSYLDEPMRFEPLYSIRHTTDRDEHRLSWHASRKPSERKGDKGTDVYLSLVNHRADDSMPPVETVVVQVTCTNRDLPAKLPFAGEHGRLRPSDPDLLSREDSGGGDLELEGAAPIRKVRFLVKPTETVRVSARRAIQWRLVSNLSLNYLSLCEGPEPLHEMLLLYDFAESPAVRQQIMGITKVGSRPIVRRVPSGPGTGFCRGVEVTIEFDEDKFVGAGVYVFAAVLERFLSLYVSLNSFVQVVAVSRQRKDAVKRWNPRSGSQILL